MALIRVSCPQEVKVRDKAKLLISINETLPFEFASCGAGMILEIYVNDQKVDSVAVSRYIPSFSDTAMVPYILIPQNEGTYNVKVKLTGAGAIFPPLPAIFPPLSCTGTAEATCSFTAKTTIQPPVEGEEPTPERQGYFLGLPWWAWLSIGIVGIAIISNIGAVTEKAKRAVEVIRR